MVEEAWTWRGVVIEERCLVKWGFLRSDAEGLEKEGIDEGGKQ